MSVEPPDDLLRVCPACGARYAGEPYDIGSGPEFNCPDCDWCWGAAGQALEPVEIPDVAQYFSRPTSHEETP